MRMKILNSESEKGKTVICQQKAIQLLKGESSQLKKVWITNRILWIKVFEGIKLLIKPINLI